jgi:hypothetical protein
MIVDMKITAVPRAGEVYFEDARGGQRSLRLSWHTESRLVVLSLWRGGASTDPDVTCVGTFRMRAEDIPGFIQGLSAGLVEMSAAADTRARRNDAADSLLEQFETAVATEPAISTAPAAGSRVSRAFETVGRFLIRVSERSGTEGQSQESI